MRFAVALAIITAGRSSDMEAQSCLSNPDTATALVADAQRLVLYSRGDSLDLAKSGLLPVDTSQVSLVTDNSVCASAVAAFNAVKPGATLTQAYVVRVGPDRFIVQDMRNPSAHMRDILVFDANWTLLKGLAG